MKRRGVWVGRGLIVLGLAVAGIGIAHAPHWGLWAATGGFAAALTVVTAYGVLQEFERDPRVGFSVTHEEDTGRHLAVEGNAELIYEGDDLVERRERLLAHYYGPEKARARRDVAFGPGVRAFVHIAPTRVVLNA